MSSLFDRIHEAFHRPSSPLYARVQGAVLALILVSVALFLVEISVPPDGEVYALLYRIDRVILGIFAAEVALRILSYRPKDLEFYDLGPMQRLRYHITGRLRFATRPLIIIDLFTVLAVVPALRGLRALRLLRLARTRRFFQYSNPFTGIARAFEENALLFGFGISVFGTIVIIGGVSIFLVERGENPGLTTLADGIWWAIVTITTVGFGDITPVTGVGRVVGGTLMVSGMFTLALFAGIVGQSLVSSVLSIREEQFRMSHHIDHIVICGYDAGARMLLDRLVAEIDLDETTVVLFAPGERPPDLPSEFQWISGDPTKESELDKVRMDVARCAILVGGRSGLPQHADATTILTAFTIRRYLMRRKLENARLRPVYIVAEILDEENVEHARAAGVDEVIETTRIGFSLVAHAVTVPGTASVLGELADPRFHSLFVGAVPSDIPLPLPFCEVLRLVRERHRVLVLGMRESATGLNELDPPDDRPVAPGDRLIYVAQKAVLPQ